VTQGGPMSGEATLVLIHLPPAIVAVAGATVALTRRDRTGPRAAALTVAGCGLVVLALAIALIAAPTQVPDATASPLVATGLLALAAGLALLLAGVFAGRGRPVRATARVPAPRMAHPMPAPWPPAETGPAAPPPVRPVESTPAGGWRPPPQALQSDWGGLSGVWSIREVYGPRPDDRPVEEPRPD
jgi:hypothetical protein